VRHGKAIADVRRIQTSSLHGVLWLELNLSLRRKEIIRTCQSLASVRTLFDRLFKVVTKFKLADRATQVLAGQLPADAPRNLRALFSRAVETKETGPRLRIEKLEAECTASAAAAQ
jgi:hypothetical protein